MVNTLTFRGETLTVEITKYRSGATGIQLWDKDHMPYMTATSDMQIDDPDLVAIKNYSENEGILEALIAAGVIEDTGLFVESDFVHWPICRIVREKPESEIGENPHKWTDKKAQSDFWKRLDGYKRSQNKWVWIACVGHEDDGDEDNAWAERVPLKYTRRRNDDGSIMYPFTIPNGKVWIDEAAAQLEANKYLASLK